jgi:hypothetical protein
MLERRLVAGGPPRPQLDVELIWAGQESVLQPVELGEEAMERWLSREHERLRRSDSVTTAGTLEALTASRPTTLEQLRNFGAGEVQQETRTPEQYDRAVEEYLDGARARLPDHIRYTAVKKGIGRLSVAVVNNTEDNFEEVAVVLTFEGGLSAYFDEQDARFELDHSLPSRPRRWGPYRSRSTDFTHVLGAKPIPLSNIPAMRRGHIDNSASARIALAPVHLRPNYRVNLPTIFVVVPAEEATGLESVIASWYATSTSVSGSAQGTLDVSLGDKISVEQLLD